MGSDIIKVKFEEILSEPLQNGLFRPKKVRGEGVKMINMGELFRYDRIRNPNMEKVPLGVAEKHFLLHPDDLLFARQSLVRSGAGKCSIFIGADEPITFEGHIIRARVDRKKASGLFCYYYFNSYIGRSNIQTIVEQVAAAGIRQSDLKNLIIPLPSLPEQKRIAHILGILDDKSELNQRMNEMLEEIARAIFKSWFVDFDPVRAKMAGEPYPLPDEIMALFPDELVESKLGLIPEGWEVKSLSDIAIFLNGAACQKFPAYPEESSLPVLKIRELRAGAFDEQSDRASFDIPDKFLVANGDVVFSWSGSLLVDIWTGGAGFLNQHLFKVTSKEYPKWFYYYWVKHHLEEFSRIAEGKATTMGHIKRSHLDDALVCVPINETIIFQKSKLAIYLYKQIENSVEARICQIIRNALLDDLIY